MTEPTEALKAYSEQCDAWERMGVLDDAPEYEEWLEQQYDACQLVVQSWRDRWTRKTKRVHELEAELSHLRTEFIEAIELLRPDISPNVPANLHYAYMSGHTNAIAKVVELIEHKS